MEAVYAGVQVTSVFIASQALALVWLLWKRYPYWWFHLHRRLAVWSVSVGQRFHWSSVQSPAMVGGLRGSRIGGCQREGMVVLADLRGMLRGHWGEVRGCVKNPFFRGISGFDVWGTAVAMIGLLILAENHRPPSSHPMPPMVPHAVLSDTQIMVNYTAYKGQHEPRLTVSAPFVVRAPGLGACYPLQWPLLRF